MQCPSQLAIGVPWLQQLNFVPAGCLMVLMSTSLALLHVHVVTLCLCTSAVRWTVMRGDVFVQNIEIIGQAEVFDGCRGRLHVIETDPTDSDRQ